MSVQQKPRVIAFVTFQPHWPGAGTGLDPSPSLSVEAGGALIRNGPLTGGTCRRS